MRIRTFPLVLAAAGLLSVGAFAQTTRSNDPANNAATRALDRAAGTDTSGAYPSQADGTANNPRGTVVTRSFDRAAGTDTSGAYPSQADGTANNPKGTVATRTLDRTTGSNVSGTNPGHVTTNR